MINRVIKYISGFLILCLIQYMCKLFIAFTGLLIPAPILGIIVLAVLLQLKILKKELIEDICKFLLEYMPLLFVPLFVGIIAYYGIIEKNLVPVLVNIIISTTLTLLVTAFAVENIIKYIKLKKLKKAEND